jgi:acetyl esterase/lipase
MADVDDMFSRPSTAHTYKQVPQGALQIHVSLPDGWTAADRRPGIVFFFGGGWQQGTVEHFSRQAAYFAGRGLLAARADYRVQSRHGVTPIQCVEDAKSAVRWLRARAGTLGLHPDRIVGSGGSAGAHIAACTALIDGFEADGEDRSVSSAADALVLFNPPLQLGPRLAERFGLSAGQLERISPTCHVRDGMPPTLLLYGEQDELCTRHWEPFMAKARQVGGHVELYLAEGVGHGFFNQSPWFERTLRRADEFLASLGYLDGPPTVELPK